MKAPFLTIAAACGFLFSGFLGGCASKPKAATDPAYITTFRAEKLYWDRLAQQTHAGMTRAEFERILPPDTSLPGITHMAVYVSKGKTRPQAHTEEWYYISPHFICSTEFDFTGLKYEAARYSATGEYESAPEFPGAAVHGSDPSQQLTLTGATIALVEPRSVKKPK